MNPFIHLLGSSLIQWIIFRINEIEEPKRDLEVRLGEAVRLGRALLRLGGALLRPGGPEKQNF